MHIVKNISIYAHFKSIPISRHTEDKELFSKHSFSIVLVLDKHAMQGFYRDSSKPVFRANLKLCSNENIDVKRRNFILLKRIPFSKQKTTSLCVHSLS